MEADRGARRLHNVEGRREVLGRAHQGAVVKVPGIQSKRGYLGSDTLDDGMESLGKPQWAQEISLLHATTAVNDVLAQEE